MQVKCPKCKWEPGAESEWMCKSCGYHWHMFETAGRCPQCGFQHEETYCIEWQGGCGEESPHLDWYEDLDRGLEKVDIFKSID